MSVFLNPNRSTNISSPNLLESNISGMRTVVGPPLVLPLTFAPIFPIQEMANGSGDPFRKLPLLHCTALAVNREEVLIGLASSAPATYQCSGPRSAVESGRNWTLGQSGSIGAIGHLVGLEP